MTKPQLTVALLVSMAVASLAAEGFPRVPPTPPEKAEATFETLHGFRMELIAAEPLVASPVDLAYDEDGRAYVVEMRDYPYPEEKNAAPTVFPGTVRLLEDADGDGKFDKATIFADQLAWPTSVCCYKGGVFVAAAPDIWYFKDTDGDHKADVRRKVFTGFSRYNVQAIMNSLRWGLDNKIYGSASGNGGNIRHADRPDDPLIQLTRRDFRFDPVTEKIEAISGGERYGASFDDWGNRFLCNIRNPVQHVVLPLEYLQRNPNLVVPSAIHDCAESGDQLRVYRLSPPESWREFRAQRWALEQANMPRSETIGAGFWTSSSGVCVYRGGAYPEQFRGNVFIGEVAGNLVHRQVLTRDGVTFKSRRADENTEFVRSRDNWFRPVNFVNAPDGTLTVLDMYRETIEHPWSIPDDIKAQLDLTSGKERGRLYRLTPPTFTVPKPPNLSTATTAELVAHLESPHSWYRETAQRLLFERQDKSAAELLRKLQKESKSSQARLHAFYALCSGQPGGEGLYGVLEAAIHDSRPEIRRHGVENLKHYEIAQSTATFTEWFRELAGDPDAQVRFQTALAMSSFDELPGRNPDSDLKQAILGGLARRYGHDPWMRQAILIGMTYSLRERTVQSCLEYLDGDKERLPANSQMAYELGAQLQSVDAARQVLNRLINSSVSLAALRPFLAGLGDGLARRQLKLSDALRQSDDRDFVGVKKLELIRADVAHDAKDQSLAPAARIMAIKLHVQLNPADSDAWVWDCLRSSEPADVQRAVLAIFAGQNRPEISKQIVSRWKQLTPPLREEAVNVLLSRPVWQEPLVVALEKGEVQVAQLTIPQRTRLAAVKDAGLAERAKKVLGSFALSPRKDAIEKYQPALALKPDGSRGKLVYQRECANCHKLAGEGHDVGPSLETIQHRSPMEILIHVLDPNREASPQFLDYTVRLSDGRVVTGMIAAETDAGLTLRRAQKQEETILRSEIDDIAASGKSLMPEGLEQKITPQELADLIGFLRNVGRASGRPY